ncbi:hypothetical protein BS47DRAFT_1316432 [Hydnum rufescens UP504]|uniref:MoaB/Mog domain-containing protein n=1 Tax=Hydnum rufescens UP504 TaxID=1448309 RepID=A0A9P6DU64_9AGAM|nr:hypothetical protein BS47DRAFT_1316432 [Hydnum rufescens UP504]
MASSALKFPNSPIPEHTIGSEQSPVRTAAAIIIGDEILNGKTADTNSTYFATYCFELGIELKRIEVIADDKEEIIEASRRLVKKFDFVVTSGGIGPTHDDITYESLAKAFDQDLAYHEETRRRMLGLTKNRDVLKNQNEEQQKARDRMALLPSRADVLFVDEELWVPIVKLEGKLCVFPGVPVLFKKLLEGLRPYLLVPDSSEKLFRLLVRTQLPESSIAPFLSALHHRVKSDGIRVGSYPIFQQGVTVSLLGKDVERVKALGDEVAREIQGSIVNTATEAAQ